MFALQKNYRAQNTSSLNVSLKYLDNHPIGESLVRVHLPYLGMTVPEVQLEKNYWLNIAD